MSLRLLELDEVAASVSEKGRTGQARVASTPHFWRLQVWYPLRDGVVILAALLFGFVFFSVSTWTGAALRNSTVSFWSSGLLGYSVGYAVFLVLALKHYCYYIPLPVNSLFSESILVLKSLSLSLMVLLSTLYLFGLIGDTKWILCNAVLDAGYLVIARDMRSSALEKGIANGWLARSALIVGTGDVARSLATHLESHPKLGYVVKGF